KGTITWSQDDHAARKYCVQTKRWETVWPPDGFERNSMFLAEMRHFLACVNGVEQPLCTLRDGREVVRIAMAAKRVIGAAEVSSQEACAMSSRFSGQTT
ncbi:MAG TPA: hypothetical protein VNZ26_35605, partial [Vicinamibacterales bacterium]|nr:hypothetical protein [Vicinamibacterales bacterium]